MTSVQDAPPAPAEANPATVCVYCASSNAADPDYLVAAERFGAILPTAACGWSMAAAAWA